MNKFKFKIVDSMEKVFPEVDPKEIDEKTLCDFLGEAISFQVAYYVSSDCNDVDEDYFNVIIESDINLKIKIRSVGLVPVRLPAYSIIDDKYLRATPGLYPDVLTEIEDLTRIKAVQGQWRSLWIDINNLEDANIGKHEVKLNIFDMNHNRIFDETISVEVLPLRLPEQKLIFTQWFHADCLADYYNVEVFSDKHWQVIDNFIKTAVNNGINMILTPVFTPPLDTQVNGDRTTVQLVDIELINGQYIFNFSKLKRWLRICKDNGIKYIEISHLFTQWGAKFTPKIIVKENGIDIKKFGWHVKADAVEYKNFLSKFLPILINILEENWGKEKVYFHISDEPGLKDIENYIKGKEILQPFIKDYNIIDALSDLSIYEKGVVNIPVVATTSIHEFIDYGAKNLWAYYCCGQYLKVSNRFISMPSYRNRIIGVQLYKYNIKGFLHWGYNFYNSQYSLKKINPFEVTDAGEAFPSGDAFSVYPGENGVALESIRLKVFSKALSDIRCMEILESLSSRENVIDIIEQGLSSEITFNDYPSSSSYILNLRKKLIDEILKLRIKDI